MDHNSPLLPRPDEASLREALRRHAPQLAGQPLQALGEGWASWVFRVGDHVLRLPKVHTDGDRWQRELRILPELARRVSLPIPVPDLYFADGPNGEPVVGHRFIPGQSLIEATSLLAASARFAEPAMRLAPEFGAQLGRFLRELHSFPVQRALDLGAPLVDGPEHRRERGEFYEEVVRDVFPLVSCEARAYIKTRFETYLNNAANFAFEPRLVHGDLDRQNTLIDPETGRLAGIIDFGATRVGKPDIDLWMVLIDFENLGIADQIDSFLEAYGREEVDLARARVEADFIQFLWPLYDITYGLWVRDPELVTEGIRQVNARVPSGTVCD